MKVLSFFSYKGGAGRSTLAYNTIPVLAKDFIHPTARHPMIILDMDIDSRGMTLLLDNPKGSLDINDKNCVQTLLANPCNRQRTPTIKEHPVLGKFCPVGHAFGYEEDEAILLVPAIAGKKIDDKAASNYDNNNPLIAIMGSFIECCEKMDVSAVMFDSSVGDQLTATVSNENANIIVCCMRPTRQFRDGTADYFEQIAKNKISSGKHIILVPNVVPTSSMIIQNRSYPDEAIYQINKTFSPFANSEDHTYHLDMLDRDCFGVPALPRFMWCEDILRNQPTLTEEESFVLSRYTKLAEIIDNIDPDD